ncbi:NAD(P)/FAD-dependent oxidoreductase [Atopomonas sediminilitoris]|uniref:NAD(P)/FAD-dependent oxidoreductase n=1 Tax=Atopomonas sediminilitoris TaxID=2919919 RepID=UPI001F4E9529|nr:NAD(P)/FAD-dependent oxidoreductase [Atopomonas sediminilitoris]MCJ8169852.1 NAD(P)/FAD-dependent oxidoreductase [Atopomonas sediminilitoris]
MALQFDCIVLGGGAAGLMCAATAGYRGRRVAVLDHANKVGKKILMSGGGRCNFTNLSIEPSNYLSGNAHFCKSALSRYRASDFIELVERHGVAYHEKGQGQLFCDNKASDILNVLLTECEWAGVEIRTECQIERVSKSEHGFSLSTSQGTMHCQSLVIATGGLSIPTMGATGFGFNLAEQFGLPLKPRWASLVPFTITDKWQSVFAELAGVAVDVAVSCNKQHFNDPLLFTHRGLSGPAILQISNYWRPGDAITLDFFPSGDIAELMQQWRAEGNKSELKNLLALHLPKRFVQAWLEQSLGSRPVQQYNDAEIKQLAEALHRWSITPSGTEGYRTAEVTMGGVDTDAVSSKTFEAKDVPGLFFIGEVLDVTGWLGGFNFQWAWASGFCAGQYV